MKLSQRYLAGNIKEDLSGKMVFIEGPRQVGKTSLALNFLKPPTEKNKAYFNWDYVQHRKSIMNGQFPESEPIWVLDEIHKYAKWRNLVKGIYDTHKSTHQIIVTGSARLDHYRKGGDSLLGRYHFYRLHPLHLDELECTPQTLHVLLKFSGFPEPFFDASGRTYRRWRNEWLHRIIRDDIRDLERVREISLIELLAETLPTKVGSPLSIESLREDLEVAHVTVQSWIKILENLYVCYRVPPFGSPRIRAVKKEQKLYLYDWASIEDIGPKFENCVGSLLLKYCHFISDTQGFRMELRYLRDTDGREVDFIVLKDKKPLFAVECKSADVSLSQHVSYFSQRISGVPFYQVHMKETDYVPQKNVRILPFVTFAKEVIGKLHGKLKDLQQ